MGADKAGLRLDGFETSLGRILSGLRATLAGPLSVGDTDSKHGADDRMVFSDDQPIVIVRNPGHNEPSVGLEPLHRRIDVHSESMLESLRAGLDGDFETPALVWPVDYAMVWWETVRDLVVDFFQAGATGILLPLHGQRVGHPVILGSAAVAELDPKHPRASEVQSLRDVIRRDPSRNRVLRVDDSWVWRDLDTPADLMAAQGWLRNELAPSSAMMRTHRSRRRYTDDDVSVSQIQHLVDSARHASTSSFLQGASVVCVRDPDKRKRIAELCSGQKHIEQAPVFLAICADLHRTAKACEQHGTRLHHEALETFIQGTVDASLVGQNIQLAAESEGLGSCMIGAARNEPEAMAELLGLPEHVYVVFGMTIGWPADDPIPRERLPLKAVLHEESYDASKTEEHLHKADEQLRAWARATNDALPDGAKKLNTERGYTDRMAYLFGGEEPPRGRGKLAEALRRLGFGLDL